MTPFVLDAERDVFETARVALAQCGLPDDSKPGVVSGPLAVLIGACRRAQDEVERLRMLVRTRSDAFLDMVRQRDAARAGAGAEYREALWKIRDRLEYPKAGWDEIVPECIELTQVAGEDPDGL